MVEIDRLFKEVGISPLLAVHQRRAYSHRSSNRITRTQICQNSLVVRTSWTNTDSPAGCIVGEREGRRNGVQKSAGGGVFEGLSQGTRQHAGAARRTL